MQALTTAPVPRRADLRPATEASPLPALRSTRVPDQLRKRIRMLRYSRRTEDAYVYWCRAFIRFHCIRHPASMGGRRDHHGAEHTEPLAACQLWRCRQR